MEIAAAYTAPFACELALAASIATAGTMVGYALGKRKRDSDAEDREESMRRRVERADDIEAAVQGQLMEMGRRVGDAERGLRGQAEAVRRLADNVEAKLQEQEAKSEQAKSVAASCMDGLRAEFAVQVQEIKARDERRAELNAWSLTVHSPYYDQNGEGCFGHFAFSGNGFLVQDTDFREKITGVATADGQQGCIVAAFPKPTRVGSIKLAAFPKKGWGSIAGNDSLCIQTLSPGQNSYEDLHVHIPSTTQEETFPINKEILALRLHGAHIRISKLIFS